MLLNVVLENKPKYPEGTKRLKTMEANMLKKLRILKENKLKSGKTENDAEVVVIDKLIQEFESDLGKGKDL